MTYRNIYYIQDNTKNHKEDEVYVHMARFFCLCDSLFSTQCKSWNFYVSDLLKFAKRYSRRPARQEHQL